MNVVHPHLASLSALLGREIRLEIAPSGADLIKKVESGHIQVGAVTAVHYAALRKQHKIKGLLERQGDKPKFTMFVVHRESPFQKLTDLQGRIIAYKSPNSMSGYRMPRIELASQGIDPKSFFLREVFANNLQTSVLGLLNQEFDCAAMSNTFFDELEAGQRDLLREIHRTKAVPGGVYIVSASTKPGLVKKIREVMLAYSGTIRAGEEFSGYFQVKPLSEADYDFLEEEEPVDDE